VKLLLIRLALLALAGTMPGMACRAEPPDSSHERNVSAMRSSRPDLAKRAAEAQLAYEMGHDALAAKREDVALDHFTRACKNGDPRGCYNVGVLTEPKMRENAGAAGPDPLLVAAVTTAYSDACDLGFQRGCAMLVPYLRGLEYAVHDSAKAITVARAACEAGENFACAELAEIYYTGEGTAPDLPEAARLFRHLCDAQWQADSCFNYALMLGKGEVGAPEASGVVRYYRLGCRRGSDAACINLANYYAESPEVPEFRQIAAGLLEQSCERGAIMACANLATLIYDHRLGSDFATRAVSLYRSACERGHGDACRSLGNLAQDGVAAAGAPGDAIGLFVKGCELGSGISCYNAGLMYFIGYNVATDQDAGLRWFAKGCLLDSASACAGAALASFSTESGLPNRGVDVARRWLELARALDPDNALVQSFTEWLNEGAPHGQQPTLVPPSCSACAPPRSGS
jgi:hypothetical protein